MDETETESSLINVQIPQGLQAGDSFLARQADGEVVTVIVPPGAS